MIDNTAISCWIYRSSKKHEMYLYLTDENGFEELPDPLKTMFGTPTLVMNLELHEDRSLAREDVRHVMHNLQNQGFHLQMPPSLKPEMYHS